MSRPTRTCSPWSPVVTKKIEPYALSVQPNGSLLYSYAWWPRNAAPMTKLRSRPARSVPCRPARMPASAQKIGRLLAISTMLNNPIRGSSGASIPAGGQRGAEARKKKYVDSKPRKIVPSVAITTTIPHQPMLRPRVRAAGGATGTVVTIGGAVVVISMLPGPPCPPDQADRAQHEPRRADDDCLHEQPGDERRHAGGEDARKHGRFGDTYGSLGRGAQPARDRRRVVVCTRRAEGGGCVIRAGVRDRQRLLVPERMAARDDGDRLEVEVGRWRARRPLERVGDPRVVRGGRAPTYTQGEVDQGEQHAEPERECAHADDEVQGVPSEAAGIRVHAAGHAEEPEDVHREERDVEADEHGPEARPREALAEHPTRDLRQPEVQRREDREHDRAVEHVVQVRDDEVAVGRLPVEGQDSDHDAGDPAEQEHQQEAEREQHRRREPDPSLPHRRDPGEELHAARDRDQEADGGEERERERWHARGEHVVHPHAEAHEADRHQ